MYLYLHHLGVCFLRFETTDRIAAISNECYIQLCDNQSINQLINQPPQAAFHEHDTSCYKILI